MSATPGEDSVAVIAARFFPGDSAETVGGRSWLLAVSGDQERRSVRQLDPGLPVSRIELIHEFLGRPELRHGTRVLQTDRSGSSHFDARTWIEGEPAGDALPHPDWQTVHLPSNVDTQLLARIAQALGAFHASGTSESLLARAPKIRIDSWIASVRRSIELDERALANEIRKESRARRWLTVSRSLVASAAPALEQAGFLRDEPLTMAHLDLWGSHIVINTDDLAFLDCSAIAAAPQIVDIAQLIARNGAWSGERVELALNTYADANPIPPLQRRVLPWLAALDAIAGCGRLLVRAGSQRNPLPDNERRAVYASADQQLDLLQALASAFVPPPATRNKRYRTSKPRSRS